MPVNLTHIAVSDHELQEVLGASFKKKRVKLLALLKTKIVTGRHVSRDSGYNELAKFAVGIFGGDSISAWHQEYKHFGTVNYYLVDQVKGLAALWETMTYQEQVAKNAKKLQGIELGGLDAYFEQLKQFYISTAQANEAVIVYRWFPEN